MRAGRSSASCSSVELLWAWESDSPQPRSYLGSLSCKGTRLVSLSFPIGGNGGYSRSVPGRLRLCRQRRMEMDAWPGDYSKPPAGVRDVLYARDRWLASIACRHGPQSSLIRGTADIASEFQEIQGTLSETTHRGSWSIFDSCSSPSVDCRHRIGRLSTSHGINTIIYYAPTIIQSAGVSSASVAILATAGIGVVNVI